MSKISMNSNPGGHFTSSLPWCSSAFHLSVCIIACWFIAIFSTLHGGDIERFAFINTKFDTYTEISTIHPPLPGETYRVIPPGVRSWSANSCRMKMEYGPELGYEGTGGLKATVMGDPRQLILLYRSLRLWPEGQIGLAEKTLRSMKLSVVLKAPMGKTLEVRLNMITPSKIQPVQLEAWRNRFPIGTIMGPGDFQLYTFDGADIPDAAFSKFTQYIKALQDKGVEIKPPQLAFILVRDEWLDGDEIYMDNLKLTAARFPIANDVPKKLGDGKRISLIDAAFEVAGEVVANYPALADEVEKPIAPGFSAWSSKAGRIELRANKGFGAEGTGGLRATLKDDRGDDFGICYVNLPLGPYNDLAVLEAKLRSMRFDAQINCPWGKFVRVFLFVSDEKMMRKNKLYFGKIEGYARYYNTSFDLSSVSSEEMQNFMQFVKQRESSGSPITSIDLRIELDREQWQIGDEFLMDNVNVSILAP